MQLTVLFLVLGFSFANAGFYSGSVCCNSLCCCPGCDSGCEQPPPLNYIGVCSCQTCQTRPYSFIGRDYSLPFVPGTPFPSVNNYPLIPPPIHRYPLNYPLPSIDSGYSLPLWDRPLFDCTRCGLLSSGCQSCGTSSFSPYIPFQRPPSGIPRRPPSSYPYRMRPPIYPHPPSSYPIGPPSGYPIPSSGYNSFASQFAGPSPIPRVPPSIGVLTAVPVPLGIGNGFGGGFPPFFPGMFPYKTSLNTTTGDTLFSTATGPSIPPDVIKPPNLKFNFPAPLVPPHVAKSVTFPASMLLNSEQQKTTPMPFHQQNDANILPSTDQQLNMEPQIGQFSNFGDPLYNFQNSRPPMNHAQNYDQIGKSKKK